MARGYRPSLGPLYDWIDEIAEASTPQKARALWGQFNDRYPPSLTYKDDIKGEFVEDEEMEEAKRGEDEPYEEDDDSMIPEYEVEGLSQGNVLGHRLRSGKK